MKLLDKKLEEVIAVIMDSNDYKECVILKEKMQKNEELMSLINTLKEKQKEYIKSGCCNKEELEDLENQLYDIPLYSVYMEHLKNVNKMISYVEDDLNDYFYHLFN